MDGSALLLLHRVIQLADKAFVNSLGTLDISPREFCVLRVVAQCDGISQTAIMNATGFDRSSAGDLVGRMVSKGWLRRRRQQRDHRLYAVRLTPDGRTAFDCGVLAAVSAEQLVLSALSRGQKSNFYVTLRAIVER